MSTFTPNKNLEEPANNADVNTWDVPVNANWSAIDMAFGGETFLNVVSASGTITLTSSQYTPPIISLQGTLTANINYQFPTNVGGVWVVYNSTSGPHTVTFSSAGAGAVFVIPQGYGTQIICDKTNVLPANDLPSLAAGSAGQIQYNSGGFLGASSNLTFSASTLTVSSSSTSTIVITGGVGNNRQLTLQTSSANRFDLYLSTAAESGSNVGSDFGIARYNDAGTFIDNSVIISRATGSVGIANNLTMGTSSQIPAINTPNIFEQSTNFSGTFGPGTLAFYLNTQSVYYVTSNATGNFGVNLTLTGSTTLNSVMTTGQSVTAALLVTQGSTAYYCNLVQVDGSAVTPKWQGGVAPTAGNASGIDVYTFTVLKTGSATFTVLASLTQFK